MSYSSEQPGLRQQPPDTRVSLWGLAPCAALLIEIASASCPLSACTQRPLRACLGAGVHRHTAQCWQAAAYATVTSGVCPSTPACDVIDT